METWVQDTKNSRLYTVEFIAKLELLEVLLKDNFQRLSLIAFLSPFLLLFCHIHTCSVMN